MAISLNPARFSLASEIEQPGAETPVEGSPPTPQDTAPVVNNDKEYDDTLNALVMRFKEKTDLKNKTTNSYGADPEARKAYQALVQYKAHITPTGEYDLQAGKIVNGNVRDLIGNAYSSYNDNKAATRLYDNYYNGGGNHETENLAIEAIQAKMPAGAHNGPKERDDALNTLVAKIGDFYKNHHAMPKLSSNDLTNAETKELSKAFNYYDATFTQSERKIDALHEKEITGRIGASLGGKALVDFFGANPLFMQSHYGGTGI